MNPAVTPLQVPTARQGSCDASGLPLVPMHSRCELALMSQYMLGPGDVSGCHELFRPSLPKEQCVLFLLSPKAVLPSFFQLACVLENMQDPPCLVGLLATLLSLWLLSIPSPFSCAWHHGQGGQCQAPRERVGQGVGAVVECSCPTASSFYSCTEILAILLARF